MNKKQDYDSLKCSVSDTKRKQEKKEDDGFTKWLSDIIDTSIICLGNEQPSDAHDKLLFQLKAKLKELPER